MNNLLNDSINCTKCESIIAQPVVLPCGHSICKYHVDKSEKSGVGDRKIGCEHCEKRFEIRVEGFARNRALENLLEKKIEWIDLGDEYNSAFDKCKLFSDLLEQLNLMNNDPETRIHSVISDLRNKVDLRREELKDEIDKEALTMIRILDDFENECKENSASIKSNSDLNKRIVKWGKDLRDWQVNLSTFKRNINSWTTVINQSTCALKELQSEYFKLNEVLFLNRLNDIKCSYSFVSSSFQTIRYFFESYLLISI